MKGFRIFKPRIATTHDKKLAYGLECIRIWKEAQRIKELTGKEPDTYYPTEEEFYAMRKKMFRRHGKGDQDG